MDAEPARKKTPKDLRKNPLPHLKTLDERQFMAPHTAAGKAFFQIFAPRVPATPNAGNPVLLERQRV